MEFFTLFKVDFVKSIALFLKTHAPITAKMADMFKGAGGIIQTGQAVTRIEESYDKVTLFTGKKQILAQHLIACGGLMADRLARMMGIKIDFMILPFKGEYYRLPDQLSKIVSHLIYPIPDPDI